MCNVCSAMLSYLGWGSQPSVLRTNAMGVFGAGVGYTDWDSAGIRMDECFGKCWYLGIKRWAGADSGYIWGLVIWEAAIQLLRS